MRRLRTWLFLGAAAALASAGIAIAHETPFSTKIVSADITATTKSSTVTKTTKTCHHGTIEHVHGSYTGTSTSSEPLLSGAIGLNVYSTFNTNSNLGTLKAKWSIDHSAAGGETEGKLTAVNSGGTLSGWFEGHNEGKKIAGTFSGSWTKDAGFTGPLKVGSASATNVVVLQSNGCKKPKK